MSEILHKCYNCESAIVVVCKDNSFFFVKCNSCSMQGPYNRIKEYAICLWNKLSQKLDPCSFSGESFPIRPSRLMVDYFDRIK